MEIKCEIEIECRNEEEARMIEKALRVDNERYIETSVNGRNVVAKLEEKNALSALHTINDFMACLQLSMESVRTLYPKNC